MKKIRVFSILLAAFSVMIQTNLFAAENKISKPFEYSGYTKAEYKSYTKFSEYVEMEDGVKIAVDVYLPAKGPKNDSGKYPVVFQYTPYSRAFIIPGKRTLIDKIKMKIGTGTSSAILDRANSHDTVYGSSDLIVNNLLSHGYAYVCGDSRGTGASFGVKVDFSPKIPEDEKQVIDWIAAQKWSDGNVGMFGGSYLGYTQLVVASQKPQALKCIFPEVVAMEGYSTEIRPGGVFCYLYSNQDMQTLYEHNYYLPDQYVYPAAPVTDEDGDGDLADEIPLDLNKNGTFLDDYNYPENPEDEPKYADGKKRNHVYYLMSKEHLRNIPYNQVGGPTEFIDSEVKLGDSDLDADAYHVSPGSSVPSLMEMGIPVYNHGSWMDTFIRSTFELYSTLKDTNPSKIVVDPGYHETESPYWKYCGEDETKGINAYSTELLRFYDRYLKGIQNGLDTEPPVYIYNMNGDGWRFENEWPLARQVLTDYYFEENGKLGTEKSSAGSDTYKVRLTNDSTWYSKWYTYGVSRYVMAAPDDLPMRTEKDKTCLTYTTQKLEQDTEVTGHPIADFWVSANVNEADFHVYLEDVDEKGNALLVTEGVLKGGFAKLYDNDNEILGGETGIDVKPELPWHGFEKNQYDPNVLADNKIVEYTMDLFPTSWVFKKGHSIRFTISGANSPTFTNCNGVDENTELTFYRDENHPSKITLPVIPR